MFRGSLISAATVLAMSTAAVAADLPTRFDAPAPAFAPSAPMTWNGLYLGVNVGAGFGGDYSASTVITPAPGFNVPINADLSAGGFTGGVQAGYNFQFGPGQGFVVGVEGDFNYADFKNEVSLGVAVPGGPNLTAGLSAKAEYFATIRGRVGYAWDNLLIYATGGAAFTKVKISADANLGGLLGLGAIGTSDSQHHTGWVVGGGLEAALNRNVSIKAEYLYADFGRETYFTQFAVPGVFPGIRAELDQHIIRTGLNYRF